MNIDTSASHGHLLRHIIAAFAEYESDIKSDYRLSGLNRWHATISAQRRVHGCRNEKRAGGESKDPPPANRY